MTQTFKADPTNPGLLDRALAWASRKLATNGGYALLFGLLFAAVMAPVLCTCLACGKSMIWMVDGLWEQYAWFVYAGQWIRDFVASGFDPLMWEMDSGYGVDVIQSLAGLFLNPMFLVSALVPGRLAEFAFEAAILATLYAAGLAFSFWCIRNGSARRDVLVGALTYTFAGNALLVFVQPSFTIMLVAFPLLLWGADKLFEHRSPVLFIAVLTWLFACSYYDAYMAAILLVLYCVQRFWFQIRPGLGRARAARALLGWVGVFAGYTLVAFLLSGFLMLPQVMALVGMDRLELEREGGLLYSLRWYLGFAAGLSGHVFMGRDSFSGFNALAPIVLVALFLRRRQHRALFVGVCALTAMMLLPAFGSLMNGLQYAANRWSWGYDLAVSLAVVRLLPDLFALEPRQRRTVVACVAAYGAVFALLPVPGNTDLFKLELVLAAALLGVLFGMRGPSRRTYACVTAAVAVSAALSLVWFISPWQEGWAKQLAGFNKTHAFHTTLGTTQLVDQALQAGTYDPLYRYDRTSLDGGFVYNSNLVAGQMGVSFYNSVYADGVDAFNQSLGLTSTEGINFRYGSLDSRAMLEALMGVRYYSVADFEQAALLPYQFQDGTVLAQGVLREGRFHELFETSRALPLAYAYTDSVTRDAYDALGMLERQAALMQAVVLSSADTPLFDLPDASENLVLDVAQVPFEVVEMTGCELLDGGTYLVRQAGASVTLAFDAPAGAEVYLVLDGLTYGDIPLRDRYAPGQWEALGFIGRLMASVEALFYEPKAAGVLGVSARGTHVANVRVINAHDHMYGGKEDWAANLGYCEDGLTGLTITFSNPGVYSFDDMGVQAQPMADFDALYEGLAANAARDIELGRNQISCSVELAQDAALFFSVAYSEGWSATVDGEPVQVAKANLGFMAVPVEAGVHEVVLSYQTPYLRAGCVMSALGVLALAGVLVWRRRTGRVARAQ